MGSWLFAGLIALREYLAISVLCLNPVMTGIVGMFLPFSRTTDLIFAIGGCLLFSGYVVYDTYIITRRLSHGEYIAAAISLYLE